MTLTDKQREETLRRINNYVPRGTDRGTWNNISDFVRATAIAATVDSETGSEVFVSNNTSSLDVRGVLRVLTRVSGSVTSFRMSHEIVPVPRTIMSRHIVPVKNHMPCNTPKLPQTR